MQKRREARAVLKQLQSYTDAIEKAIKKGRSLPPGPARALEAATGTVELDGQLRAMTQIKQEIDRDYDDALRRAAYYNLSCFCEFMFRDEPPAHHHEFLIDHMERVHTGELQRLMINMPPGAAKSSYASIRFPAWHLGRRPNDRWLQGAHTQGFAKDRLGKPVRSLMQETRYKMIFPESGLSSSSSAADYFEFVNGRGYYKAVGVGVGISGYRADIAGIDDPIASREDAESPTVRRKLHDWFMDDFGTRPMPGSPIFIVNTRWHPDDLSGFLLQRALEGKGLPWEVINIPAIALEDDPLGRAPGEGLWPEVFGTSFYLEKKRSLTGRSWNSLYMGNPVDEEGGVLKREDVRRYKNVPEDVIRGNRLIKKVVKRVTLSVDCAEKATQRSDFTAATVWIETYDKKHHLVHAARCKKEFNDMVKWIEEIATTFGVDSILVEDRGAGTQYIQVREKHPGPAPVIAISTKQQSKDFRFDGVTPMFPTGQALLPEHAEWIAEVEEELFAFPNGRNDDYVDSVSQYLAYRRGKSGRRGVSKIKSSQLAA